MMSLCLMWTLGVSLNSGEATTMLAQGDTGEKIFSLCASICSELFPDRPVYTRKLTY